MNGYESLSPIGYGKSRLSSAYRLERGGGVQERGGRGGIMRNITYTFGEGGGSGGRHEPHELQFSVFAVGFPLFRNKISILEME